MARLGYALSIGIGIESWGLGLAGFVQGLILDVYQSFYGVLCEPSNAKLFIGCKLERCIDDHCCAIAVLFSISVNVCVKLCLYYIVLHKVFRRHCIKHYAACLEANA